MKKNPTQTEATRETFKSAFWRLYGQKPIDRITVKEITDIAGYNRGTFYVYYKDVYDVLEQIEQEIIDEYYIRSEIIPKMANDTLEWSKDLEVFIQFYDKYESYISVLLGQQGDPSFTHKFKEAIKKRFLESFDHSGHKDEYILEYIASAQVGMISFWFRQGKKIPIGEMISLTKDIMFEGAIKVFIEKDRSRKAF